MGIYARHLLRLFLVPFLGALLLFQLFVGLCGMLSVLGKHPYLPLIDLAAGLPDLVLIFLPVTLPVALLVGYLLFARKIHGRRLLLWVEFAGRDPRLLQAPIVAAAGIFSLVFWWMTADVIPKAEFASFASVSKLRDDTASVAARLAWGGDVLPGFRLGFRGVDDGRFTGFSMTTNRATDREEVATAVTADVAEAELLGQERPGSTSHARPISEGRLPRRSAGREAEPITTELLAHRQDESLEAGRFLQVNLYDGRLVQVVHPEGGGPRLSLNMRFEALRLRQDAHRFTEPSKAWLLDTRFYTNAELAKLPEQARLLSRKGLPVTDEMWRRAAAGPAIRAARLQGALLPLMFVLAAVLVLGRHSGRSAAGQAGKGWGWRALVVGCLCLALLLPEHLVLEGRARKGMLSTAWLAFLPTIELGAGLALWGLAGLVKAMRRRAA